MAGISGAQVHGSGSGGDDDDEVSDAASFGQVQEHLSSTDDLLDEIDGLLETNAEEFVRSYVQKGGQ